MTSTRSQDSGTRSASPETGDKRPVDSAGQDTSPKSKKPKIDKHVASERSKKDQAAEGKATAKEGDITQVAKQEAKEDKEDTEEEKPVVKGDETKKHAHPSKAGDVKPDGMGEGKKDEEPNGPEVEGNAGPGEIAPGMKEIGKEDAERRHGVLEKGHVYFLFRPKVETDDPHSLDDVSKFHMLLVPDGGKLHRLVAIGKKHMPDADQGTRPMWGQVVDIGKDLKALKSSLGPSTYETKTRGTRHQPGARVAGSGAYVLHSTENPPEDSANASAVYHTYLAYELAVPHEIGEAQEALHIHSEGSFTLQVKNPDSQSNNLVVPNQPEVKHPQFPPGLKHYFTTKYIPTNPPALLNYAGAELLLIPSKHKPAQDLGENAKAELDDEEKDLEQDIEKEQGDSDAKKALEEVGLEGLIEGKALEGHWE
ncbi:hypothetical protein JCM11641_004962 [Rhodosporidiobolus odoratus]